MHRPRILRTILVAMSMLALQPVAVAQQPSPDRTISVLLVSVKPDMLDEWTDLVKNEVLPALKKAGIPSVTAMQTALGNSPEFQFVTPLEKMSMLDLPPVLDRALGKEGGARLNAKLRKCTFVSRNYLATVVGSLSNPAPTDRTLPIRVYSRYRVTPGKTAEYENYIKTEVLPHYKKAGVAMSFSRRGLGAPAAGEVVIVTQYENFAALEGGPPLRKILGEDAYTKLQSKAIGLRVLTDTIVRRHRPDLSY
ncbi:MAG: hypothetical protein ACKV22_39695 [Bryobacteraceae bacterium]